MKPSFFKVYTGPGYPVDPAKEELCALGCIPQYSCIVTGLQHMVFNMIFLGMYPGEPPVDQVIKFSSIDDPNSWNPLGTSDNGMTFETCGYMTTEELIKLPSGQKSTTDRDFLGRLFSIELNERSLSA